MAVQVASLRSPPILTESIIAPQLIHAGQRKKWNTGANLQKNRLVPPAGWHHFHRRILPFNNLRPFGEIVDAKYFEVMNTIMLPWWNFIGRVTPHRIGKAAKFIDCIIHVCFYCSGYGSRSPGTECRYELLLGKRRKPELNSFISTFEPRFWILNRCEKLSSIRGGPER